MIIRVYIRKGNFETLLDSLKDLLVLVGGNEGDGEALGTETASTTDAVQVGVGISREIVVDSEVDALDINTTAEDVGGNANALVELLEFLVTTDTIMKSVFCSDAQQWSVRNIPLLLADTRVNRDGGEVALAKQLVQLSGAESALDEDNDLVELKLIQQLVQLPVLLLLLKGNVVLLKTVEGQFGILIDIVLGRVLHKLAADRLDLIGQGSRKHHHLLLLRSRTEDLLYVAAHV